ncbi:hypothetical protein [Cellulomonas sp. URHE0023]|uniref:hypothetical protein n=1 Tax=Cellulomonas sp. URHE0023 TaxID=1380354 RepID=UPI000690C6E4|nr:hypothetical protein [Cellulomonas sp. URHE0023]
MSGAHAAKVDDPAVLADLGTRWLAAWPLALAAWGPTTRLHAPVLHDRPCHEGSFAWFRVDEVEVHIDLPEVLRHGVEDHPVAVLAHELGHHLLAPGDPLGSVRIAARIKVGLGSRDNLVGLVSNLWSDMLINDRLQRQAGVDMAAITKALGEPPKDSPLGLLVMRTYEILWALPRGFLTGEAPAPEGEAMLCARHIRAYARDPVAGAAGFAVLVRSLLDAAALEQADQPGAPTAGDGDVLTVGCAGDRSGDGTLPPGAASDTSLGAPAVHPALDPRVVGDIEQRAPADEAPDGRSADSGGQDRALSPAELHAVLVAIGRPTSLESVAMAWYREHASPYLVPFPVREPPVVADELLGGLTPWELGDDLGDIDWAGTVTASPVLVPGVTTVRREMLEDESSRPAPRPVDLDLYLDSSGSMPDPQRTAAPIALAGAVLALSALRAGARVQATTWSGPGQLVGTDGFTGDAEEVLRAVVAHIGGSTAFPVDLLARTHLGWEGAAPTAPGPTHIAVISDEGVDTMFRRSTKDGSELDDTAARSLESAAGGSLVLRLWPQSLPTVQHLAGDYDVYVVSTDDDLVPFARDFSRRTWGRAHGG